MLVLTRKSDEQIRIGDDIVITVLRTKGKAVRLGIEAPGHMRVLRGEIAFEHDSEEEASEPVISKTVHTRIPRSQVAAILPALAAGGGPLAGFINSGAVVSQ
jgi:carbon storage regulator